METRINDRIRDKFVGSRSQPLGLARKKAAGAGSASYYKSVGGISGRLRIQSAGPCTHDFQSFCDFHNNLSEDRRDQHLQLSVTCDHCETLLAQLGTSKSFNRQGRGACLGSPLVGLPS
jgi:hypothetical protein